MATLAPPAPAVDAGAGTLTLPNRCKPSKACSTDWTRPNLCHAYLRDRGKDGTWLCATDSYIATAIKVDGHGLVEGWIPIGALRLMERGKNGTQISDAAWRVETSEGVVTYDITADVQGSKYPDFDSLGLWDKRKQGAIGEIGMSPRLMAKIGDALGADNYGCRFEFTTDLKSIRVTPLNGEDRIGLQMPVRLRV